MHNDPTYIDLRQFRVQEDFRGGSAVKVQLWWLVQDFLIRPSPQFMYGWRRFWWKLFGAKLGENVIIRPTAKVTYPWKVTIGDRSWIGDHAELYSLGEIVIGSDAVVSQHVYICAGTHDYTKADFPLVAKRTVVEDQAWIATRSFIAPGVTVGRGAVVGAQSLVLEDVPSATICAGHPAKVIKPRPVPA